MGATTGIPWTDATWNPWVGCTKVSEGCENCYMFRDQRRYGNDPAQIRQTKGMRRDMPIRKKRDGSWQIPPGSFVFVCSCSDFFHEDVPSEWRNAAMAKMSHRHEDLTFLLLTKRVEGMREWCDRWYGRAFMDHIWLGVTIENQHWADIRVPEFLEIDWPGKKFVSIEPMLGRVDCSRWIGVSNGTAGSLSWVIVGGESGPGHRPFELDWARSLKDQCVEAGVPFFFKQTSGVHPEKMPLLDGKVWAERPGA